MQVKPYPLIRGLASYVLPKKIFDRPGSGGSFSSEYCYSVWLRHLHYLLGKGLFRSLSDIKHIAEIGPGDSLGIGMSALYTGAEQYYAFDVIEHANLSANQQVNQELLELFSQKAAIPNTFRQRNTSPSLPTYDFPHKYLTGEGSYYQQRKLSIDKALEKSVDSPLTIKYIVPWLNTTQHDINGLDLIFSQAVMEHVADIEFAYKEMYRWLRNGGVISHQVDFKTHEMTKEWNGHWFIGDTMWEILSHGRKYPMNRLPLSVHVNMIKKAGFTIKHIIPVEKENAFKGQKPKVPYVQFFENDLITSGALIQAVKE